MSALRDPFRLRQVRLQHLRSYLLRQGWARDSTEQLYRLEAWRRGAPEGGLEIIATPIAEDYKDYPARIAEVISTLADYEQRRPEDIYRELIYPAVRATYQPQTMSAIRTVVYSLAGFFSYLTASSTPDYLWRLVLPIGVFEVGLWLGNKWEKATDRRKRLNAPERLPNYLSR